MNELKEIRNRINELDGEIFALLKERMSLSREVGNAKLRDGAAIFVPDRETEVLKKMESEVSDELKLGMINIWKSIMRFSRKLQYNIHVRHDKNWAISARIQKAIDNQAPVHRVAYGGKSGSYSQIAAGKMYPGAELFPSVSFREACQKLARGEVEAAVIPIENTTAGIVDESYHLVVQHAFYIHKSVSMAIQHALISKSGTLAGDIKKICSHPQALAQCSDIISRNGWEAVPFDNTSYAAEYISKTEETGVAAIASRQVAELYGLEILTENISNRECNQTRFVSLTREWMLLPDAGTISILMTLPHESGSLASMLNIIGDSGFNLTKIQSRPIPDKPWEYMFYMDIECGFGDKQLPPLLYQLEKEMPSIRILGWYKEERSFAF